MTPVQGIISMREWKANSRTKTLPHTAGGDAKVTKPSLKKRPSKKDRTANDPYAPKNNLVDSIRPGLTLLLVGLNPGLETARMGYAYAHRSNRFWPILHASGVTPKRHQPSETQSLMDLYSIGNTNIASRPTRDGSTLSKEELAEGADILGTKVRAFRPEAVAIVGKGVWETIWLARTGKKPTKDEFKYGWQEEEARMGRLLNEDGSIEWEGSMTFVASTTSARATKPTHSEQLEIWKPLGEWFTARRERDEKTKNSKPCDETIAA